MTQRLKILTLAFMTTLSSFGGVFTSAEMPDDSLVLEESHPVIFIVNKSYVQQKDLKWITDTLRRELANQDLMRVYARAAASPEGPYDNNVRLSKARSEAINKFLRKYGITPDKVVNDIIPEDYWLLRAMLRRNHDAGYEVLDSIMKKYGDSVADIKFALQKHDGGKLWQRLLREYFPELRAVRLMLFYNIDEFQLPSLPVDTIVINTELGQQREYQSVNLSPVLQWSTFGPSTGADGLAMREPRRELLSIKTNLLFDLAYVPGYDRWCPIPNIAVEYYPLHGHFTFGASFDGPWWQHYRQQKYFQLRNYQLETRYYFRSGDIDDVGIGNGAAYKGWYVNGYVNGGLFSICFDADRGWEGEGLGGGLGLGYVLPLGKREHWRLEFAAQVGFFWCKHDPFQYECPVDPTEQDHLYYYKWTGDADLFKRRQHQWSWFGPTRIGVTLSYDLLYRRNHKNGASLKAWEYYSGTDPIYIYKEKGGVR